VSVASGEDWETEGRLDVLGVPSGSDAHRLSGRGSGLEDAQKLKIFSEEQNDEEGTGVLDLYGSSGSWTGWSGGRIV
jgi:hypothetical protein